LSPEVKEQSSNEGRIWGVILPAAGRNRRLDKSHYDAELVGVAVYVLREASYLPQEQFMKAFEDVMRDGLTAKVLVARPFPELLREFYGDHSPLDEIEVPERLRTAERWPVPPAHEELRWRDGPAPGYDETSSHEAIARRYEVTPKKIPITLARLAQSPEFQHTLASLRSEGWKDWHVLLAVANTVFNVRMWNTYGLHGPDSENAAEMQHSIIDVADDLEAESLAPVDLDLFSVEKLHQMMDFGMAAVLKVWGLECHQLAPDIPAMRDFLARRYKFWTDDIPHEDPFTLPQQSGIILVSRD
jgi:hypothetical protein